MRQSRAAFTLIELLVVISIVGILMGLIFGLAPGMIAKANQTKSLNNMKQIATAFMMYASDNNGRLPSRPADGDGADRWPKLIHDYLQDPKVFVAPDDKSTRGLTTEQLVSNDTNNTSYIMNGGLDPGKSAAEVEERPIVLPGVQAPSQTILLGLLYNDGNFFLDVGNDDQDLIVPDQFGTSNNYVFFDGSARTVSEREYDELNKTDGKTAWLWLLDKDAE